MYVYVPALCVGKAGVSSILVPLQLSSPAAKLLLELCRLYTGDNINNISFVVFLGGLYELSALRRLSYLSLLFFGTLHSNGLGQTRADYQNPWRGWAPAVDFVSVHSG